MFGSGIKLIVLSKGKEIPPAFYEYELDYNNRTKACMATGFTKHNVTNTTAGLSALFQGTEAVRDLTALKDDDDYGLYSQVVVGQGCENLTAAAQCDDMERDPKSNFLILTVLWLRLIFIKTIIFNGLMTLRVWLS